MTPPNPKYSVPLDVFVMDQVKGEYTFQPHLAPSEAVASLRYAFREGIGRDRPEVYKEAVEFVDQVIAYFKGNEYNNYVTRFGSARMADLLADLETTRQRTFIQVMTDPTLGMGEKQLIWSNIDKQEPILRVQTYDLLAPPLQQQFARHELSRERTFEEVFPPPPGLALYREQLEQLRREQERQKQEQAERDEFEQK
ncbi:MAG: hypothetical protein HKO59_09270 [Phycisphaerales bacterium]|nr:hypothetical protein [Phycisphaerales bacterium]